MAFDKAHTKFFKKRLTFLSNCCTVVQVRLIFNFKGETYMYNKLRVKKKVISIALALVLSASLVAGLPMNVFAMNGKSGVATATHVVYDFDIKNVIELANGETFNAANHVQNVNPASATASYSVKHQTVFGDGQWVLDGDGKVQKPGIAEVEVQVGSASKSTYIIANIDGILRNAAAAASAASNAASDAGSNAAFNAAFAAATLASNAANFSFNSFKTSVATSADFVAYNASKAYDAADNDDAKFAWDFAMGACYDIKTACSKGLELESKLETACMAYWTAEAIWTQLGNNTDNLTQCRKRVNVLHEAIGLCYKERF